MLAPFCVLLRLFAKIMEFLWKFGRAEWGKWKLKWKFEKWKALLAHMSVFIISKKPVLANRFFELFEEWLRCTAFIITIRLNFKLKKNIVKARYLKESELLERVSYYFSSIIAFAAL